MSEQRYYFDTSIWIDIYEKRGYHGEVAKKLLEKIILEDNLVIFSNYVEKELEDVGISETEIQNFLHVLKPDNIKKVQLTKEQGNEARRLVRQRHIPFGDAVHAVISRDTETQLVSRDWDFEKLRDITRSKKPEELI